MKPIIKYQGGKTRELPIIKKLAPTKFDRIVEPFAGGAAVSFAYEKPTTTRYVSRDNITCKLVEDTRS